MNISSMTKLNKLDQRSLNEILEKLEIPSILRNLFSDENGEEKDSANIDIGGLFDNLSFPSIASIIIGGANFVSTKVMHDNRDFLNYFAADVGQLKHPAKVLWLTDTFADKNGVAVSLNNYMQEICKNDLPVDFLVCDNFIEPADHLKVIRPIGEYQIPVYKDQLVRIPNIMEVHEIFKSGGYDRIICSTEFPMGLAGLYLKKAFNIPAYFFMHTDWVEFAKQSLALPSDNLNRLTRMLRYMYRSYDKLFVLNSDHKNWLAGRKFAIKKEKIIEMKHWVDPIFSPGDISGNKPQTGKNKEIKFLFVGRISEEKGVLDCIDILLVVVFSVIFLVISVILIYLAYRSKNPANLSIGLGIFTGGISGIDPVFKSISLHIDQSTGYLPTSGVGWIFFLTSFICIILSFWVTQFGFSRKVPASILVTMNSSIFSILPIIIQLNALPGYDMVPLILLGLSCISLGALITYFPLYRKKLLNYYFTNIK